MKEETVAYLIGYIVRLGFAILVGVVAKYAGYTRDTAVIIASIVYVALWLLYSLKEVNK